MDNRQKNTLLVVGIIFQLLAFLCFLTFWLMYLAIIFFVIGAISIFLSKWKWHIKVIALTPMLYSIGVVTNALYFEKYIVPHNFTGVVYVITDKQIGENREYDFFTRIYRIPKSGVLFTKFNQYYGFNERKFYETDKNGKLKALEVLDYRDYIEPWVINPPKNEPPRDRYAVFTPDLEYDNDTKSYRTMFTVGKYNNIKIWNYLPKEIIDSIRLTITKRRH